MKSPRPRFEDGGPATAATLNQPTGTAEDAAGDLFIADAAKPSVT